MVLLSMTDRMKNGKLKMESCYKQLVAITTSRARSLSSGEVQIFLKLNSRPQHPLSGRDVTLVTEREGWGLIVTLHVDIARLFQLKSKV